MNKSACTLVLGALLALLLIAPSAQAGNAPVILAAWTAGDQLVIEGEDLIWRSGAEPSVTLGDELLPVLAFTSSQIEAVLPTPPLGAGSFLLTVESKKGKVGVFWMSLGSPVPKTGQGLDDYVGEDGDLREGVEWPIPRFTSNEDGTVIDNLTGLVWLEFANCGFDRKIWTDALDAANTLAHGRDCDGDGSPDLVDDSVPGDWRLPNIKELESLIDYGQVNILLDPEHPFDLQSAFPHPQDPDPFLAEFWTSTSHQGDHHVIVDGELIEGKVLAYLVHLGNGFVGLDGKWGPGSYYVWPVRDGM